MRPRKLPALTALVAATALTLTSCGTDSSAESDKIDGADKGTQSSSPSPSPSPSADKPELPNMNFPKNVELVFKSWTTSGGAKPQAALDHAANYVRSITYDIVKQGKSDTHLYFAAPNSQARSYAEDFIKTNVDQGLTLTGTDIYHKPDVRMSEGEDRAVVSFCQDQSEIFSKEVETGKVKRTEESLDSYLSYEVTMEPVPDVDGLWWAKSITVKDGGIECKA